MDYLITTWFGTFLYDEKGVKKKILFPTDKEELVKRLQKIEENKVLEEEKKLAKKASVIVQEKRLQHLGTFKPSDPFFKTLHITPEEHGFSVVLLHEISLLITQKKTEGQLQAEDLQIIQMVDALDDLIHISNLLSERLDRWSLIPTPEEKKQPVEQTFTIVNEAINRLGQLIEEDMRRIAPNTTLLAGSLIGARLISLAGSIHRLALLPASTIQILGAEKALFRFKKEGGKPPKHGIIFQHQLINRAPKEERGKLSRLFASKIALAVKADVFTKRLIAVDLKTELENRVQQIRKKR